MARDDFSERTRRGLASRVGWRCSNPGCRALTVGPSSNPERHVNLGVAAHITAAAPGGPRFDSALTPARRRSSENGIWLCQGCAKLIDSDPEQHTVGTLRFWKHDSEELTRVSLGKQASADLVRQVIRFSSIAVVEDKCLWWSAHRLHKVGRMLSVEPDFGFHQVHPRDWASMNMDPATHSLDPILDVVLINDGERTGVVSRIGVQHVLAWTDLKGLPIAERVPLVESYRLRMEQFEPGKLQLMRLPDPIYMPSGGLFRFRVTLQDYRQSLYAVGNESLIRISVEFDGELNHSRLIYMGVY